MPLFLGVDAGGTKTHAAVTDDKGVLFAEAISGPGNPLSAGDEIALASLKEAVGSALAKSKGELRGAHFGIAGAGRPEDEKRVMRLVRALELPCPVSLSDDAKISFYAAADPPGAVLICGTGSIAVAYTEDGKAYRSGGHGYLLGDEGSGFWIGREASRTALRAADGRGETTELIRAVPELLGCGSLEEVVSGVYAGRIERTQIASLARHVVEMEDSEAKRILSDAADELVLTVGAALHQAGIEDEALDLVLSGGLLERDNFLRRRVEGRLEQRLASACIREENPPAAMGAARLARLATG